MTEPKIQEEPQKCDCGSLEKAKQCTFCFRDCTLNSLIDCTYYEPLKGEGEVVLLKRTRVRRSCELCSAPAEFRVSFVYPNCRANPASKGYRKDDCSWCADEELFACNKHKAEVERYYKLRGRGRWGDPEYEWCATFPLAKFPHMGLTWKDEEVKSQTEQKVTLELALQFIDDTIKELEAGSLEWLKDPTAVAKAIRYRVALMRGPEGK